jgi:hypothetical protein
MVASKHIRCTCSRLDLKKLYEIKYLGRANIDLKKEENIKKGEEEISKQSIKRSRRRLRYIDIRSGAVRPKISNTIEKKNLTVINSNVPPCQKVKIHKKTKTFVVNQRIRDDLYDFQKTKDDFYKDCESLKIKDIDKIYVNCVTSINNNETRRSNVSDDMKIMKFLRDPLSIGDLYKNNVFIDVLNVDDKNISWTSDSQRCLEAKNAGGNSVFSEALSIYYFEKIYGCKNAVLEMDIKYWVDYKMIDYVISLPSLSNNINKDEKRLGVSVTRAMGFPYMYNLNKERALKLLNKKLNGLIISRNGICENHNFNRSILHVWCPSIEIANLLKNVYEKFDIYDDGLNVACDVILLLTVCDNEKIYKSV